MPLTHVIRVFPVGATSVLAGTGKVLDRVALALAGAALLLAGNPLHLSAQSAPAGGGAPPPLAREMRGAWIASVSNIDWPSRPGLTPERQRDELRSILDTLARLGMNAAVLQVRPAADALYPSELEPWSEYLTGTQGVAPDPFYDPLAFAVEEAHARGLELHAWFNPYRARHPSARSPVAASHVSRARPELVRTYGTHLWMDPGEPAVQQHSIDVILDVVRRYDIDGVHIDDYFYPYRERDSTGALLDFPDETSWQRYVAAGGTLGREDWRRSNVDTFVERLYAAIKREKPAVQFGVSPFGIWRPGNPPQIQGFDAYTQIYADARLWLERGWVDYFTPQLYWAVEPPAQSYPVLLSWWVERNLRGRHIWPGNFTSRVGGTGATVWPPGEILEQIRRTRAQPGATGNIHFSVRALMQNREGLADSLARGLYARPAVIPASPWLGRSDAARPSLRVWSDHIEAGEVTVTFEPRGTEDVRLWVLRVRRGATWSLELRPGSYRAATIAPEGGAAATEVAISAIDRFGRETAAARARIRAP